MISKAAMELEAILSYPLKPLLELDAPASFPCFDWRSNGPQH